MGKGSHKVLNLDALNPTGAAQDMSRPSIDFMPHPRPEEGGVLACVTIRWR